MMQSSNNDSPSPLPWAIVWAMSRMVLWLRRPISKRQLGLGLFLLGLLAIVGMLAIDLLGAGQFQGIGPAQRRTMLVAGLVAVLGLSLWPLGDRPA